MPSTPLHRRHSPSTNPSSTNPSWTGKMAARRDPISQQFSTEEEREIARSVVDELKGSDKTLNDCLSRLVLANVTGYKMDVVKDFVTKFPRYGSFTPAQRDYAISIISGHHLPKLLELLAEEADTGETAVEAVPEVEVSEREKREKQRFEAQARVEAKREAYREKQAEIARLNEVVADYDTEANATYGMF